VATEQRRMTAHFMVHLEGLKHHAARLEARPGSLRARNDGAQSTIFVPVKRT
jgi:hypothetical protein